MEESFRPLLPLNSLLVAIVDSSDDAIVSKNLEGIITSWNKGAERLFGYKAEEIIGRPVTTLIPADRQDEEPRIIKRLKEGQRVDHFETIRVRKNGETFPVSLTISPIKDSEGVVVGASKIARDISETKRLAKDREQLLEAERHARTQAETASRMKDEFLAVVSHELRTPLNAILGWTELLGQGSARPEEVMEGAEIIKRNVLVQAQIIDDLLDLGRIVSGKMRLQIEPVDLPAIIHDALAAVQHSATSKGISIKPVLNDTHGILMGDSKRLQQVVWNLLTNAIKFTPKGGRVWITVTRINSHIDLAVADNGAGISAEFLPHVFERFSQADASTTRRSGGLGIGLALVKQLVEMHAGSVKAESPGLGAGTKFTVTLPIAATHQHDETMGTAQADPDHSSANLELKGIKVLALDDDVDSLAALKRILQSRNAEVCEVSNVADALRLIDVFHPHVVLSDIGMPGQDGYEFIRQLRLHPLGRSIPAAALTALTRSADRTKALRAGFQTHVAKPVSSGELLAVVKSLASLAPTSRSS